MSNTPVEEVITAWKLDMETRGLPQQTLSDDLKSVTLCREQLRICGYDLDSPNLHAVRDIAEGWKYLPVKTPSQPLNLEYVNLRIGGVQKFFHFAVQQGYFKQSPFLGN